MKLLKNIRWVRLIGYLLSIYYAVCVMLEIDSSIKELLRTSFKSLWFMLMVILDQIMFPQKTDPKETEEAKVLEAEEVNPNDYN